MKYILITLSLVIIFANTSSGQGCSDAGACTMGSFVPGHSDSMTAVHNQFKVGSFFGAADNSITVYGGYLEYSRHLAENFRLDLKLTTLAQSGNGISTFGLSDLFFNANYRAGDKLNIALGAKIPLTDGGDSKDGLPLPMDYQSSLGTYDLVFGVGYEISDVQIVAAIQQPLTQNENRFLASEYPASSELSSFQSTNKFQRAGDVLLRVSYPIPLSSNLSLTPSILPIYHLANDKFTDELNVEREIVGSQGLTLNGNIYLDYQLNETSVLQLNAGFPFIVRDARPDGLTRSFIANLEYRIKF